MEPGLEERRGPEILQKLEVASRLFPVLFGGTAHHSRAADGRHTFDEIVCRRNTFTHPTSLADLATPPDLVLKVRQASLWFLQQLAL